MSVIFWDFDGTLAHSVALWPRCGYEALRETDERYMMYFREFKEQLLHGGDGFTWRSPEKDHTGHANENWWPYMNDWYAKCYMHFGVPEGIARAAAEKVREKLVNADNYVLYEDVLKSLSETKMLGHRNVLLSNNYPELPEVMEGLGILEYFDGLVISGLEGYDKPRRELFDIAMSRYPAGKYYMVGDNPVADMLGARNAGITGILVHNGESENADYCFDDLYSVVKLLKESEDVK